MMWMDAEARFAEALDNFQSRPAQQALALTIESSFESLGHLLAQAGCGTGKSFAGVVPAIGHSKRMGKPVVYATATKALQDQLASKDLPFLKEVLDDFEFVVLKGRSNYVCRQKVSELESPSLKAQVEVGINEEGFSGEVADLGVDPVNYGQLTTTSEECPGKRECPFGEICFSEVVKKKAKTAQLIVTNHAVLAADLSVKEAQMAMGIPADKATGILPPIAGSVIDEAHELEDYVTSALGETITEGSFGRLGRDLTNFLSSREASVTLEAATSKVFNVVRRELNKREDKRNKTVAFSNDTLHALADPIDGLIAALLTLDSKVLGTQIYNDDKAVQKRTRLDKRIRNMIDKLRFLMTADFTQLVRWMSVAEGKRGETIEWAPLHVGDFLADNLWGQGPAVLMSATLNFDFTAERLSLPEKVESFDAGTPFDFQKQAKIFIPQIALPAGSTVQQWRAAFTAITGELLEASNGRALELYTSRTELEEAHRALAPKVQRMGHKALKQGEGTTKALGQQFKDDVHSVLFATKSFFTGIDVQGDALRMVSINKLPFPVPSDVIFKARCDAIDKGGNAFAKGGSFWKLTVPTMALTLQQGFGRLIRTVDDRGLVVIGDPRLYGKNAKSYGALIMGMLPECQVLTDLGQATDYLRGLDK